MLIRPILALTVFVLVAPIAPAQSNASHTPPAAKPLTFDVVSVKPNRTGAGAMLDRTPPDGYSVDNYAVLAIIGDAFGIRYDLISGPGWINSEHYDVTAKVAGDDLPAYQALSKEQRNQMLQAVLADRFHLIAHTVEKEMPGYTLTIAKNGPKLAEAGPDSRGSVAGPGRIRADAMTISKLCDLLSRINQQTVLDQTGLTGTYTFRLRWADLDAPSRSAASAASPDAASEPSGLPALPTALEEQLGLKLTPTKVPTTTLVIDSIERPSEN